MPLWIVLLTWSASCTGNIIPDGIPQFQVLPSAQKTMWSNATIFTHTCKRNWIHWSRQRFWPWTVIIYSPTCTWKWWLSISRAPDITISRRRSIVTENGEDLEEIQYIENKLQIDKQKCAHPPQVGELFAQLHVMMVKTALKELVKNGNIGRFKKRTEISSSGIYLHKMTGDIFCEATMPIVEVGQSCRFLSCTTLIGVCKSSSEIFLMMHFYQAKEMVSGYHQQFFTRFHLNQYTVWRLGSWCMHCFDDSKRETVSRG